VSDFVHLHVHSCYSLRDSIIRVKDLVRHCAKENMHAVALTDHGVMFAAVEFYEAAKEAGIKPIVGMETYVAPGDRRDRSAGSIGEASYHLTLLARDGQGYKNLMRLATAANVEGFYYRPRIDREILAECSKGLIGLSGCLSGEAATRVLNGQMEEAKKNLATYTDIFGKDNFFVEIMRTGAERQNEANEALVKLAREMGLGLVATNDVHYLSPEDGDTHDLWLAIGSQKMIKDENRRSLSTREYYFRSAEEMKGLFKDLPEAIENTVKIAEGVDTKIELGVYHFPHFDPGEGQDTKEVLTQKVCEGAKRRYKDPLPDDAAARVEKELSVIKKMGFTDYMLIVQDVVEFARAEGIPVGPGRGSAAGSIVCYALGITDIDPLRYDLLFERFINEGRNEMPDIDLDFAPEGRAKIIRHLEDKYGHESVKSIIAFSELKAKAAIKDVARALDLPPSRADAVCKFIPSVPTVSIDEALEDIPEVKDVYDSDPEMKDVIDKAKTLEGLVRQSTVHASGVVIGDKALENYTPLYYNPSTETITTQYEMKIIERVGLLKVDILGLATLTLVTKTLDIIRRTGKEAPDLDTIPLDDKKTFALLGAGNSRGIFQFESDGMRRLLQQAKPNSIEDLIALNALFRPGPMQNIALWVNCKHGREKVSTLHPIMDKVLETTYGVIVYQEQVMRLASEMAGFTLSEADSLRRAMGKKKEDVMAAFRTKFLEGAKKKNIPEQVSSQVYDSMSQFAKYGFNKSHSAAYAVLAYRTAYLKAHFPAAFMAALLSIEEDPKKVVQYLDEARIMGIKVLPPDVNESEKDFTVVDTGVRFGLATVKGLGEKAAEVIIEARKMGKFADFFDLVERVDTRLVNRQVFETLAKSGGLDSLRVKRNAALAAVQDALTYASNKQAALARGQGSLFGGSVGEVLRPPVPDLPEWTERQKLEAEKEVLGFYISSHPMTEYASEVKKFISRGLGELEDVADGQELLVAGIVESLSVKRSKKSGELWASLTIEDLEGRIEVIAWPSVYAEYQEKLKNDRLVFVQGHAKVEEAGTRLMADDVFTLAEAPARVFSRVVVSLPEPDEDKVKRIRSIVKSFPGPVELCLEICEDGQKILIQAGNAHRVNPTPELVAKIEEYLGPGTVKRLNAGRRSNGSRTSSRRFAPKRG